MVQVLTINKGRERRTHRNTGTFVSMSCARPPAGSSISRSSINCKDTSVVAARRSAGEEYRLGGPKEGSAAQLPTGLA